MRKDLIDKVIEPLEKYIDVKSELLPFSEESGFIPIRIQKDNFKELSILIESINKKIKLNEVLSKDIIFNLNGMYDEIREYRLKKVNYFAYKINSEIKKFSADFARLYYKHFYISNISQGNIEQISAYG